MAPCCDCPRQVSTVRPSNPPCVSQRNELSAVPQQVVSREVHGAGRAYPLNRYRDTVNLFRPASRSCRTSTTRTSSPTRCGQHRTRRRTCRFSNRATARSPGLRSLAWAELTSFFHRGLPRPLNGQTPPPEGRPTQALVGRTKQPRGLDPLGEPPDVERNCLVELVCQFLVHLRGARDHISPATGRIRFLCVVHTRSHDCCEEWPTCLPSLEGASRPCDVQLSQAVDQHVVQETEEALWRGEAELGEPLEERGDRQFRLYLRY
ncbi:hypothetical protein ABH917_001111 [Thermobifida halotolerans]